jgi:hypothetical protein
MPRLSLMPRLLALGIAAHAVPALAQGEGGQDRSQWDWGQHRTGFAVDPPEMAPVPAITEDHWDYPGAPVRFAGQPRLG